MELTLHEKCMQLEFFWSLFPCNQSEYSVSFHIQSECRKIQALKTPDTGTFHGVLSLLKLSISNKKL